MKLFVVVAVVVCFCFGGGTGASQLPGLEGVRGCEGGRGASQLWSCVVLFCGEWRRVSFRGAKGGESALELGVKLFVVVVAVLFVFVLGRRGASQLWSWV